MWKDDPKLEHAARQSALLKEALAREDLTEALRQIEAEDFPFMAITPPILRRAAARMDDDTLFPALMQRADAGVMMVAVMRTIVTDQPDVLRRLIQPPFPDDQMEKVVKRVASTGSVALLQALDDRYDLSAGDSMAMRAAAGKGRWDLVTWLLPRSDLNSDEGSTLLRMIGQRPAPEALLQQAIDAISNPDTLTTALKQAARAGNLTLMDRLAEKVDARQVAHILLETALVNHQPEVRDRMLDMADLDQTKNLLVERIQSKPNTSVTWADVDALGQHASLEQQGRWLAEHPGHLPDTERRHRADTRALRAEGLGPDVSPPSKRRRRPS